MFYYLFLKSCGVQCNLQAQITLESGSLETRDIFVDIQRLRRNSLEAVDITHNGLPYDLDYMWSPIKAQNFSHPFYSCQAFVFRRQDSKLQAIRTTSDRQMIQFY